MGSLPYNKNSIKPAASASTSRVWTRFWSSMVRSNFIGESFTTLNDSLVIQEDDSDVVCQPGVGWVELNETLKRKGSPIDSYCLKIAYLIKL